MSTLHTPQYSFFQASNCSKKSFSEFSLLDSISKIYHLNCEDEDEKNVSNVIHIFSITFFNAKTFLKNRLNLIHSNKSLMIAVEHLLRINAYFRINFQFTAERIDFSARFPQERQICKSLP